MIYQPFESILSDFASRQRVPLGLREDPYFEPPTSGVWLEWTFRRNGVEDYGLANDGPFWSIGQFRVFVLERTGRGFQRSDDMALALSAAIPKGTKLNDGFIESPPALSGPLPYDDRIQTTVTFNYRY